MHVHALGLRSGVCACACMCVYAQVCMHVHVLGLRGGVCACACVSMCVYAQVCVHVGYVWARYTCQGNNEAMEQAREVRERRGAIALAIQGS